MAAAEKALVIGFHLRSVAGLCREGWREVSPDPGGWIHSLGRESIMTELTRRA